MNQCQLHAGGVFLHVTVDYVGIGWSRHAIGELHLGRLSLLVILIGSSFDDRINSNEERGTVFE